MKLLVTCDHVFDCLTRGPFPSGDGDDEAVQRHLDSCHECRQLAEALRPAVALMHEALPAGEAAELPSYGAADEDQSLCQRADGALAARIRQIMDQHEVQPRTKAATENWVQAARYVAASVLLLALGALLGGMLLGTGQGDRQPIAIVPPNLSAAHQPTAEGLVTLASLKLPQVCLPGMPATGARLVPNPVEPAISAAHVCCTRCHAAGKEGAILSQRAVAALQQSCMACHEARS